MVGAALRFRTLPIAALAACGFALIIDTSARRRTTKPGRVFSRVSSPELASSAVVLSSPQGSSVKGLVTAASIWNAGARDRPGRHFGGNLLDINHLH